MLKKTIVYIGRRKGEGFIEVWQKRMDRWEGTRLRLFALLWFITTLALGVFIPTILVVVKPAGALAALFVFVFPGETRTHHVLHLCNVVFLRCPGSHTGDFVFPYWTPSAHNSQNLLVHTL
jgi:hypothetical protein